MLFDSVVLMIMIKVGVGADKLEHFLILFLLLSKLMHFTTFQISRFPSLIAPRGLLASDAWMGPANLVSFRIPGHPRRNCRTVLMEVRSFQVIVATGFVFAFSMDDDSIHAPLGHWPQSWSDSWKAREPGMSWSGLVDIFVRGQNGR